MRGWTAFLAALLTGGIYGPAFLNSVLIIKAQGMQSVFLQLFYDHTRWIPGIDTGTGLAGDLRLFLLYVLFVAVIIWLNQQLTKAAAVRANTDRWLLLLPGVAFAAAGFYTIQLFHHFPPNLFFIGLAYSVALSVAFLVTGHLWSTDSYGRK